MRGYCNAYLFHYELHISQIFVWRDCTRIIHNEANIHRGKIKVIQQNVETIFIQQQVETSYFSMLEKDTKWFDSSC